MMNDELNKQVQACEIDILSQIHQICEKYNLEYFGIGGTALGAVRHQGFIPWDDDIDIGMPRQDYEKFLSVVGEELPEGYHVQNFQTEPKTPFYFTKIRRDDTLFVEYYLKDYDIHQGIFVDIFPFDNVPEKKWLANIHFRICQILYQLFLAKSLKTVCSSRFGEKRTKKSIARKILHCIMIMIPKVWIYRLLDWNVRFFNRWEATEISHITRRRLRVFLKDLYPIRYMKFDTIEMPVPNDYDVYLKAQFGDYGVLPPEDKRYGHLPYKVELNTDGGQKS